AGLALSVSAWAWRLRDRLATREARIERTAASQSALLAQSLGALNAFDDIRIGLTSDGGVTSLAGAPETIAAARADLIPPEAELESDDAVALALAVHAANPSA